MSYFELKKSALFIKKAITEAVDDIVANISSLCKEDLGDVGIDLMGPFIETNMFGCRYALTCYDFYNHFLVAVPIRAKRPTTVARAIVTKYLMVRSCPRRFHSDRGEEFMSEVLQEVNELLSVGHRFSSPTALSLGDRLSGLIVSSTMP